MTITRPAEEAPPSMQNSARERAATGPGAPTTTVHETHRPHVVIVGSGFGGLNAAREFAGRDVDVTVFDRNNYHGFWPLLYQVATAGLEPESIAYPVRAIFRRYPNVNFRMAEVTSVDLERKLVHAGEQSVAYDYLILAAGSANNYFGNDALANETYGLKDLNDAQRLRNRVLYSFEQAVAEPDPAKRRALLTFVIIGGGPTGVELSGAFSELIRFVLRKDFPRLDVTEAHVVLLEATDKILGTFPESLQRAAKRKLEEMRVEVRPGVPVDTVEHGTVTLKDGSRIDAATVVWAAGVRSATVADTLGTPLGRNARVQVAPSLSIDGHPEVFTVGDMAYLEGYGDGGKQAYPMVAQVAIQQGRHAARNILRSMEGKRARPFIYKDKGSMATIGRRFAVLDGFHLRLSGRVAWFGWLLIHIMYLIGFRNRLIVMTNWTFNYFSYERGVRLITGIRD